MAIPNLFGQLIGIQQVKFLLLAALMAQLHYGNASMVNLSVYQLLKAMKMRLNVYLGHKMGSTLPHAPEIRISGFGK